MVYRGTYRNGVVILDVPANLTDGQRVSVDVVPTGSDSQPASSGHPTPQMEELLKISGIFSSGRTDGSVNHDHYIYGTPRREETE